MGPFDPQFDGQLTVDRLPDDFVARIGRRVIEGLFIPGRRDRANYHVVAQDRDAITFTARGFLTTYNIGLNEVTVRRGGRNQLQYHVSYRGWTRAAVAHGALFGLVMVVCYLLVPALPRDIASHRSGPTVFWGMVGFWALVWPWLLTAFHRRPAERALQRILRETLGEATAGQPAGATSADLPRAS